MAFFGDPVEYPDHANRGARATLAMQRAIGTVGTRWSHLKDIPPAVGIGITSGPVTVGTIGSPNRPEYTVVGNNSNNVNLAARLTPLARPGEILADETTVLAVEQWAEVVNRGQDFVKGRRQLVTRYEITGVKAATIGISPLGAAESA